MSRIRRKARCVAFATCTFVSAAAALGAQSDQQSGLAPVCPSGATPVIDSSLVTVQLSAGKAWRDRKYSPAQRTRILSYADAICQRFEPPATLGNVPMLGAVANGSRVPATGYAGPGVVGGRLVIIVGKDGRLKVQAWEARPLSITFANAVTQAVIVADSMGGFADMPPVGPKDGDTLALDLVAHKQPIDGEPTLLRARIPFYLASRGATVERQPTPEYPEAAKSNYAENDGIVSFIVGSDGRAVASSVQVTRTDFTDFIEPMRQAVVNGVYRPGVSGGCSIPLLVSQPWSFKMHR